MAFVTENKEAVSPLKSDCIPSFIDKNLPFYTFVSLLQMVRLFCIDFFIDGDIVPLILFELPKWGL